MFKAHFHYGNEVLIDTSRLRQIICPMSKPEKVQSVVCVTGFVKLRRFAEKGKLKHSVCEVEATGHLIFTSRNRHLLFIALPWLACFRWSSARLTKCLKTIFFEGQPYKGLQAKATPDCRLDAG